MTPAPRLGLASLACLACLAALFAACADPSPDAVPDHHDEDEPLGRAVSALSPTDTVAKAVVESCSTVSVKGLATQLVSEIQCLSPNTLASIDGLPGFSLGGAVFPYLQTNAQKALVAAQKARGVTMTINSGLRALPQQYLLYRWYQTGRCGIGLAAKPGSSNHESALAVDIADNAAWRTAMVSKGFKWLGSSDPVHYDFTGGGTVDMSGLSVMAFQRLWNRNHPNDAIAETGDYDAATAARLPQAPVGGFAIGATCTEVDAGPDASPPPTPGPSFAPPEPPPPPSRDPAPTPTSSLESADEGGCRIGGRSAGGAGEGIALALAALVVVKRRRGARSRA